jgi:2-methylcitrate dehydratase
VRNRKRFRLQSGESAFRNPKSAIETTMTLAERIADYAANLKFEQLDTATVHEVKRRLLDSLACACGAYRSPTVQAGRNVAKRVTAEPGAHYLGGSRPSSPELAAFVNGVLFRYLDYNDTYLSLEPAHPSDNFAAVLAAAEAAGQGGRELITAVVIAYDIQCRLCDAASIRARGWDHVTYGAFSTSAAAGRLLGLDAAKITQALNLAGTPNITLRQTRAGELSEWKGCAFANASRNGVFAALLAAEGLTGPSPIFEGEMGFWKQVSGEFALEKLAGTTAFQGRRSGSSTSGTALEGRPTEENGDDDFMIKRTSIKYWPAEYHSQSAIHAALELRKQLPRTPASSEKPGFSLDLSQIDRIDIASFDAAVDIIGKDPEKWRPKTRETADHSLPYCTAVALVDGDVTLDSFSDARLKDDSLLELVSRIKIHRDTELTARYPRGIPNRITVTLKDGSQFTEENEFPRGHDQNPMSDDEVEQKFRRLATRLLDEKTQSRVVEQCWNLETLSDVGELLGLFPAV